MHQMTRQTRFLSSVSEQWQNFSVAGFKFVPKLRMILISSSSYPHHSRALIVSMSHHGWLESTAGSMETMKDMRAW